MAIYFDIALKEKLRLYLPKIRKHFTEAEYRKLQERLGTHKKDDAMKAQMAFNKLNNQAGHYREKYYEFPYEFTWL